MKKIKVLHTEWSTGWGGQEMRILSEAVALRDKYGVEVFIATKQNAQIAQKAKELGFGVELFGFRNSIDLKSIFSIANFVRKNKIDIINTHSGKDTWVGWAAARLGGAKFIRTRHLANVTKPHPLNFVNSCADFIITTGEKIRENFIQINKINPQKIKSIPTGIDENIFKPEKYDKNAIRDELGLKKDALYIGNIGVFRDVKRLDIFLQIALEIHRIHPDICFVLCGDGDMKNMINDFIAKHDMSSFTKVLGFSDEPAKFLAAIDIFLLTSSSEGVPQTLIQALFMKKPCIATNVGGIKDLYKDENFLLVDFDESKLFAATKELVENAGLFAKLKENDQNFVRSNFSKEKMCDEVYGIYKRLLKD